MTSFKTKLLVAGLYCFASAITYLLLHELMGMSVYRNVIAASIAVLVFIPFARRLNTWFVLTCIVAAQVVFPTVFVIFTLLVFVGAPADAVLSVVPGVAGYCALAWVSSTVVFLIVSATRKA